MLPGRPDAWTPARAFSLIELLVVIAIIALLVSILLPALREARRAARAAVCMANLQQFGRAHAEYAHDHKDFIAAFNGRVQDGWNSGDHLFPTMYHCCEQAREIVGRYDPRVEDVPGGFYRFSPITGVNVPMLTEEHSHLVLADYMGERVLMPSAVCPEDGPRRYWQSLGPIAMMSDTALRPALRRDEPEGNLAWRVYSSTYQLNPAAYLRDPARRAAGATPGNLLFNQGSSHGGYNYSKGEPVGGRKITEVAFPAQKVAIADSQQRHAGRTDLFYGFPEARQPVLMWDSSVSTRITKNANRGWNRLNRGTAGGEPGPAMQFNYVPDPVYESPIPVGASELNKAGRVYGYYKWTRGGLSGIDFGGGEIDARD